MRIARVPVQKLSQFRNLLGQRRDLRGLRRELGITRGHGQLEAGESLSRGLRVTRLAAVRHTTLRSRSDPPVDPHAGKKMGAERLPCRSFASRPSRRSTTSSRPVATSSGMVSPWRSTATSCRCSGATPTRVGRLGGDFALGQGADRSGLRKLVASAILGEGSEVRRARAKTRGDTSSGTSVSARCRRRYSFSGANDVAAGQRTSQRPSDGCATVCSEWDPVGGRLHSLPPARRRDLVAGDYWEGVAAGATIYPGLRRDDLDGERAGHRRRPRLGGP